MTQLSAEMTGAERPHPATSAAGASPVRSEEALGVILALLLSFLPPLLLRWNWEPAAGGDASRRASDESWHHISSLVAASLRRASTLPAWVRLNGQAIGAWAEALWRQGGRGFSPDRAFSQARVRGHLVGLPRGLCWAFVCEPDPARAARTAGPAARGRRAAAPDADRAAAPDGRGGARPRPAPPRSSSVAGPGRTIRLCRGVGLESDLRSLFTALAEGVVRAVVEQSSEPADRRLARRIQGMFGEVVFPELFGSDFHGEPFAVVFRGKPYYLVWRLVHGPSARAGGPAPVRGGFFLLIPIPADPAPLVARLCFRHWDLLRQRQPIWPVFVPLPVGGRARSSVVARPLFHPRVATREVRRQAVRLAQDMPLSRGDPAEGRMGQVRLPGRLVGQVLDWGAYRARLCPLADGMPYLGVLVAARPSPRPDRLHRLASGWTVVAGAIWGVLALARLALGRWPTPALRLGLVLWFLGLVSLPLILSGKSGLIYLADLGSNLLETQRRRMARLVAGIEAGSARLRQVHRQACRSLMAQPDLVERWRRVQAEGEPEGPLLAEMSAYLRRQGVDPTAILVFGHGGWQLATFSPDLGEVARSSLPLVLDGIAREILGPMERAGALASATVGRMQALHARRPELKRQVKASMPLVPAMGVDANTDYLRRHVGEVQELFLGQRCFTFFFDLLPGRATPSYAPFILWNHQLTARRYLAEAVPEAWLGFLRERGAGLDLAAFQQEGSQWKPVSIAGDGEGLVEWAQACEQRVLFSSVGGAEIMAVPLKGLPGFVLVVRLSLAPLRELLGRERALWGAIMLSLLGLTVLGGYGLSRWLAGPVVGMTTALQRVTGGDLAVRIPRERVDELGQAAATLDTMITWLRERERLLPFVSPKALEATGSGNLFAAGIGSVQTVAVLVSDIRSFTTLTETHPPAAIFEALNEHLAAMAAEVQAGGGQIDRFVGDAVWAVFFAEAGRPPVEAAVAAARAMMRRHAALNARRQAAGRFPFAIGVGLEVGEVVVGILGDPGSRLDFTMIGEAVSEAARWEAASKLGTRSRIVASARVVAALPAAEQACWHRLPVPEDIYEREADLPPSPEADQDRPGPGQGPTGGAAGPLASLFSDRDGGGSA